MEVLAYSLPFIISIFLLVFFKKYIVWWEYISLICVSIFFTFIIKLIMIDSMEWDTEYLGGYITKITHYDEWDEWVHKTCTRQVPAGRDSKGNTIYRIETYDCSYRDYHPEMWCYTNNKGYEAYFYNKEAFDQAMKELGNPPMVFRDMHRHYYTIDGDAQDYFYDGKVQHIRALVWKNLYRNKILASNSIFKFENISEDKAKKLGLFEYPDIIGEDQKVILGVGLGKCIHKQFKYINSIYGAKKQFRIYVLIFKDKPLDISEKQKSYWQGGNKNEFVLCLGYNSKKGTIDWCNPFSWCDKPKLEVATKRFFREHNKIYDLKDYAVWLEKNLHLWKRKEFKDFDYIENVLTKGQGIALLILILILDIICSFIFIANEYENEELYEIPILLDYKTKQRKIGKYIYQTFTSITDNFKAFYDETLSMYKELH